MAADTFDHRGGRGQILFQPTILKRSRGQGNFGLEN
jgi:hypothetical protein